MGTSEDSSAAESAAELTPTDSPRAATCALVYSDVRHVPNINQILEDIEEVLFDHGFAAHRLGDEIRTGQGYPESLRRLLSDCVLGVAVLDGLRPNVAYELGFLFGMNKPVIVLQSVHAEVAAKTLYSDSGGLQKRQFDSLRNPALRQDHFSDFDRTHVGFFDCAARKGDPRHLKTLLNDELDRKRNEIVTETTRSQTTGSPQDTVNELSEPVAELARLYYGKPEEVDVVALRRTWDAVRTRAEQHGIHVPPATTLMAAATWMSKAGTLSARPEDRKDALATALELYEQARSNLAESTASEQWADAQFGIGCANNELSLWDDPAERNRRAIDAFEQALKVYTSDRFPTDFATTQNNLGNALRSLAEIADKAENCRKAIAAFEQALKVRTLERFPTDFAATWNNLGNALNSLAEVEDKAENCKKAIAAFEQALKIRTLDRHPTEFATTQNSLGNAFSTLAEVEDKAENCRKAIAAFEQALKVRTRDRSPLDFAATQSNLGTAHNKLADAEDKAENCRKAIAAYEQALKVRTRDRLPIQYASTQNNIGNAFRALAEAENRAENCRKAIAAYEQALKVRTRDGFPLQYAVTHNNLGNAFRTLATVEDKDRNCRKSIAALEEAARVFSQQNCPGPVAVVMQNLEETMALCHGTGNGGKEPAT